MLHAGENRDSRELARELEMMIARRVAIAIELRWLE